jgi:hypothetical protein
MKLFILDILIVLRLLTNDGIMLENRRPIPKRQPPEVIRFVRRLLGDQHEKDVKNLYNLIQLY